jgi:hypothetical protein
MDQKFTREDTKMSWLMLAGTAMIRSDRYRER